MSDIGIEAAARALYEEWPREGTWDGDLTEEQREGWREKARLVVAQFMPWMSDEDLAEALACRSARWSGRSEPDDTDRRHADALLAIPRPGRRASG